MKYIILQLFRPYFTGHEIDGKSNSVISDVKKVGETYNTLEEAQSDRNTFESPENYVIIQVW